MRKIKESLYEYASLNAPNLLRDYSPNNPLSTKEIGSNSVQEVEWICPYGHVETETVQKRRRRGYCSVCGPKESGSFAQNHPELLPYWSEENTVDPHMIPPTYTLPIKWKCKHGHIHENTISRKIKWPECPICRQEESRLFRLRPELRAEWDETNNAGISPDTLGAYSNVKCHWICKNGHSYEASPAELMRRKTTCPTCASLGFLYPEVAKEWHPTANGDKTPFDVTANSQYNAVFLCSHCNSAYTARVANRIKRQSEYCPECKMKSDL